MKRIESYHIDALCTAIDNLTVQFEAVDNDPLMAQMNIDMGSLRELLGMLAREQSKQIDKSDNQKVKRLAQKILKNNQ